MIQSMVLKPSRFVCDCVVVFGDWSRMHIGLGIIAYKSVKKLSCRIDTALGVEEEQSSSRR